MLSERGFVICVLSDEEWEEDMEAFVSIGAEYLPTSPSPTEDPLHV